MTDINDIRLEKGFNKITFSNYKKSDAKKELLKCLNKGDIEASCYWTAEFICAGHFKNIWEIFIEFTSRYIHLANPKLPMYMEMRFEVFKNIVVNGYVGNELSLRNNNKIRKLFAEIISILCLSRKKHCINPIKIEKEEFQMTNMTKHLKAKKITYSNGIFRREDPKELLIAVNELGYHLSSDSRNALLACYWVEWIIEFSSICKESKADRRAGMPVEAKFQTNIIWIAWEMLLHYGYKKNKMTHEIIKALLKLFCIRFGLSSKKKRRYVLYFAVSLITENVDYNIKVFESKDIIENVKKKIDVIYKQIKKNEEAPKTDYLFNNSIIGGRKNLENTIKKIETMNSFLKFVPRK